MAFKKRLTAEQTVRCYSIHDPSLVVDATIVNDDGETVPATVDDRDDYERRIISDLVGYGKTLDRRLLVWSDDDRTEFELRPLSVDEHDEMLLEQMDGSDDEPERKAYAKLALKTAETCATVLDDELELSELPFKTRVELGGYAIRLSLGQLLPDGEEAADDVEK
jgi:hypothetical protein